MDEIRLEIFSELKRKYPRRSTRELWEEAEGIADMAKAISLGIATALAVVRAMETSKKVAAATEWTMEYHRRRVERWRSSRTRGVFVAG